MEALLEEKEKEIVKKGEWLQVSSVGIAEGVSSAAVVLAVDKVHLLF